MRRVRDLSWLGILVALPIAVGHAQTPEAASGKGKTKPPSAAPAAPVAPAAAGPKPAQLETPPWAADETKPAGAATKPAAAGPAADKPTRAGADKPNKAGVPAAAAEPASAQKTKSKRPSKAESELASARTAPPAPPPPAAGPKPVAPQPAAAPKPAGPNCSLEEAEQPRGGRLDVLGSGFGQAPVVRIAARPARMIERRTDRISVQVPADSDGGAVTLQSEGQSASCGNLVIIGKNR